MPIKRKPRRSASGFFGDLANLAEKAAFARRLGELPRVEWVVHPKPSFGSPEQVPAHLGRYAHRVAIPIAQACPQLRSVRFQ